MEATLRLADIAALLASVQTDEVTGEGVVDPGFLSALDYALRGDSGCVEPEEWADRRRCALRDRLAYINLPPERTVAVRHPASEHHIWQIPAANALALCPDDCVAVVVDGRLVAVADEYGTAYTDEPEPFPGRTDLRLQVESLVETAGKFWENG